MEPTSNRAKFGITSPIQPITPLIHTDVDVRMVEQIIIINRKRSVFTPRVLASSSPRDITLICQRIKYSTVKLMNMGILANFTLRMLIPDKLPMSQKVMAGSLSKGSATYFISDMADENSVPTSIPVKTNATAESVRILWLMVKASNTDTIPKVKAESCIP